MSENVKSKTNKVPEYKSNSEVKCFPSPVHEAAVLEVITVSSDLQLPAGEAFPLVEGNLQEKTHLQGCFEGFLALL